MTLYKIAGFFEPCSDDELDVVVYCRGHKGK